LLAALLALSFTAGLAAAPAAADDSPVKRADYVAAPGDDSQVVQVSYTTGASGHKLVWRPYRSDADQSADNRATNVEAAQYQAPADPPAAKANPFSDPFDDARKLSQTPPANLDLGRSPAAPKPQAPADLDVLAPANTAAPSPQGQSPQGQSTERSQAVDGGGALEKLLVEGPKAALPPCRTSADLKKISEITYNITPETGSVPPECPLGGGTFQKRCFVPTTFTWKASCLCHKPLYFEDEDLDRYGHTWGLFQPVLSSAHFFASVGMLPYNMGLQPPSECIYSLGYYRPGSCAPYKIDPMPFTLRAAAAEASVATGIYYFLPQ
jgi:hypothetical protein